MAEGFKSNGKAKIAELMIKAFKEDCKGILYEFSEIENGNYQDFAQLWKDKCFGLITLLHKNISKITSFNKECLAVAKDLFLAKEINYSRIAALYLLFTLYERQSIRCGNRINVDVNEYKLFTDLICDLYEKGHDEAKLIFLTLDEYSAFDYCLTGDEPTDIEEPKTNENTVNSDSTKLDDMVFNEAIINHLKKSVEQYREDFKEINKLQKTKLTDALQASFESMEESVEAITSFFSDSKPGTSSATNDKIELMNTVRNKDTLKKKAMAIKSDPKHTVSVAYPGTSDEINDSQAVDKKKKVPKHNIKDRRWKGSVADMIEAYDYSSDEEESDVIEMNLDVLNMSDLIDKDFIQSELCEVENKNSSLELEEADGVKTVIESQDVNMSE